MLTKILALLDHVFFSADSLKAELSEIREKSTIMGGRYKHNQLLEDLRNLQESLAQEKKTWALEKDSMEQEMEAKKKELAKIQVSLCSG
jgi:A-kinase anchor protein 13